MWMVLILLAVVGGGLFLFMRSRRPKFVPPPATSSTGIGLKTGLPEHQPAPKVAPPREMGRMLQPGDICCKAARSIATTWYPDHDAPRIPLITCDQPQNCKCLWQRVLDRRTDHRRVAHDRRQSVRFEEKSDRRTGRDRRKDAGDHWKES